MIFSHYVPEGEAERPRVMTLAEVVALSAEDFEKVRGTVLVEHHGKLACLERMPSENPAEYIVIRSDPLENILPQVAFDLNVADTSKMIFKSSMETTEGNITRSRVFW